MERNKFANEYIINPAFPLETPSPLADFVNEILEGNLDEGSYSYQSKKGGLFEYYLNGANWDKLTISHKHGKGSALTLEKLENCVYSRNYYEVIIGKEKTKCRIVCSFKGNNNLTMMVGMGEGLKEEYIINITPTDNDNVHTRISYYEDLSQLRNQRISVTKDDEQVLESVTKTAEVEGTYSSSRVVEIVRDILRDPANAKGLFTLIEYLNSFISNGEELTYALNTFAGLCYPSPYDFSGNSKPESNDMFFIIQPNSSSDTVVNKAIGYIKTPEYSSKKPIFRCDFLKLNTQNSVYDNGHMTICMLGVNDVDIRLFYGKDKAVFIRVIPTENGTITIKTNCYEDINSINKKVNKEPLYSEINSLTQALESLSIKPVLSLVKECKAFVPECVRRIIGNPWLVIDMLEQKCKACYTTSCVQTQAYINMAAKSEAEKDALQLGEASMQETVTALITVLNAIGDKKIDEINEALNPEAKDARRENNLIRFL